MLKRSVMTLYSDPLDIYSHQVRIVLAEKGINVDIIQVNPTNPPEDLANLNPYNTLPVLVDRDLVLYEPLIIMEYLDERFPHPPLLPVYPIARARCRLTIHRVERDWYSLMRTIETGVGTGKTQAKKDLLESLLGLIPVFEDTTYFLNDEFTLVDCCLAPLFWRLPHLGIRLPPAARSIKKYMEKVFARDSVKVSLSDSERELRDAHVK
ncbi:MAG: stringent starvation protein A [Gammaproteobacteria bacterium RIFOXYB2_FULL_38_6]|nr:MAG: stringent starvation protein A [Gammaproteobacteria bacterium RIFOXYB2_FULL_38_6]